MIIDPGLYSLNKSEIWWIIKQRSLPTSFKLYTGLINFHFNLLIIFSNYLKGIYVDHVIL
jgi:hypothetical protein